MDSDSLKFALRQMLSMNFMILSLKCSNALFPLSKVQFSFFNGMSAYMITQDVCFYCRTAQWSLPRKHNFQKFRDGSPDLVHSPAIKGRVKRRVDVNYSHRNTKSNMKIGRDFSFYQHDNKAAEKRSVTSQEQRKEVGHRQSCLRS